MKKYSIFLLSFFLLFQINQLSNAQVISFDRLSTSIAGTGANGYVNGPAATAQFWGPRGITLDNTGNIYVADFINESVIRKISTAGVVSTAAGTGQGYVDGPLNLAKFALPTDLVVLNNGVIYVASSGNHTIRKISGGVVSTFVGLNENYGFVDGTGSNARFDQPYSLVFDAAGNMYVTDEFNHAIRKVTPGGVVTTIAGNGTAGYADGNGSAAQFSSPMGIAIDAAGNLIVADYWNHCIRKVTPAGDVTTIAGIGGTNGFKDGLASTSLFYHPGGVAIDKYGNIYVADQYNHRVRKITPSGYVITVAGNDSPAYSDGIGGLAGYSGPADVVLDPAENIFVSDDDGNRIRKIAISFDLNTFNTTAGYASPAQFVAVSGAGLTGNLIVSAPAGFEISTSSATGYSSTLSLTGTAGVVASQKIFVRVSSLALPGSYSDSLEINSPGAAFQRFAVKATVIPNTSAPTIMPAMTFSSVSGSGTYGYLDGAPSVAMFGNAGDIVRDVTGNIYVADYVNHRIRKVTPDGTVSTFAGSGVAGFADGTGLAAQFNHPAGITIDGAGIIYVADETNHRIRKITSDGTVTTIAGSGVAGAVNGMGTAAQFKYPTSIAADLFGNLFVADNGNNKIRKIISDGTVSDFGGTGYNSPTGIAVDINGTVYVADQSNRLIRKITAAGVMTTLAGAGTSGALDGLPTTAQFGSPTDVTVDPSGNVYVTDSYNQNIRRITQTGVVTTLGASTNATNGFLDGINTEALLYYPRGLNVDADGNIYVFDNDRIRKIAPFAFTPFAANSGTPSYEQRYSVVAANLSTDLIITAPAGFEISLSGSTYSPSITISPTAGNIRTSIYVRVAASASAGNYSSMLNFSSTGAVAVDVPLNANVNALPATVYFERTVSIKAGSSAGNVDGNISVAQFNGVRSVVVDKNGTTYISDVNNSTIRAISKTGTVTTFATGFYNPWHLALDDAGNLYVCDRSNYRLKKITPAGVVTVIAGNSLPGNINGTGTAARLNYPYGIAMDKQGNMYVTEEHAIRKITPAGVVTTLTGGTTSGYKNGTLAVAKFFYPRGIVCDKYGNLFVTDNGNHCVRKISVDGIVSTVAGKITYTGAVTYGSVDGSMGNATFFNPDGIAIDSNGVLYIGDYNSNKIRQIINGYVTTIAGTGTAGAVDGSALSATFNAPNGIAVDTMGNLLICDEKNNRLRKLSLPQLTTFTTNAGTVSAVQSFKVNGTSLQGDLIVTAPVGFEVSLSASSGFASSVSIAAVSGAALNKVVYIRVSASATAGNHSDKVILSSLNAAVQMMPVTSTVSGTQTITFNALPVKTYLDPAFTITTATASSGLPVTFTSSNPAVATVSGGIVTIVGAGTATITASQSGNAVFQAATNVTQILTVNKADQTITFAPIPDAAYAYPSPSYTPTVSSTSGLAITLTSSNTTIATVSGSTLILKNVGTATITATQAGNANYNAATATQTVTINKANQVITFGPIADKVFSPGYIFALPGYTSVGLFVSYTSSNPAVATVSGNTVTLIGSGTTTITASEPGNANFNAAASVTQTLTVTGMTQQVTFSIGSHTYGDPDFTITGFATSFLPVTYTSSNPNVATIVGNTVTIVGAGNSLITASQPGDNHWLPAPNMAQWLIVDKANQTITFNALADKSINDGSVVLTGVSSSGLDVVYTSSNPAAATVSGNTVTIVGVGTTTITASQPGNSNYNAAANVQRTLTVTKAPQTITFDLLTDKFVGDADFALIQNTDAGLAITYTSSNPAVATVLGNTITIIGAGTTTITASQTGNANYDAATTVSQNLTVNKKSQTISFNSLNPKSNGDADFVLSATASSGLDIAYTSSNAAVATVSGNIVTIVGEGTSIITATQAGNNMYMPASDVIQTLTVGPATAVIHSNHSVSSIYPNPAADYVTVTIPYLKSGEEVKIIITNSLGSVVQENPFKSNGESFKLDTGDLAKGVYILTIQTKSNFETKTIIVQ